ncbi:MAG: alginate lyase family protein [Flavobacteriales bacterium]|nr:alginate lyase family protein [Flavobacteriales bacterium]
MSSRFDKIEKYFYTIKHLKFTQIRYQLWYRIRSRWYGFTSHEYPLSIHKNGGLEVFNAFIPKQKCYFEHDKYFSFLNVKDSFNSWNDTKKGMLWVYNLNYMDYLLQEDMSFEEGKYWIDKFINEFSENKIGTDPYPIALRGINWIKFLSIHKNELSEEEKSRYNSSLYAQYLILKNKLEYHLLGNHLLEDAFSLFIASVYFSDEKMYRASSYLLKKELCEQILPDGAHYEQSPMYHCILLDRLLDCINIGQNIIFGAQKSFTETLKSYAAKMLGHLDSITWQDGSIPLLNDSAYFIAPNVNDIFSYAKKLDITWKTIPMCECGYRKYKNNFFEAIVDVGNITASYQCGHSHADTFNYELRINGNPFIVDTGISTYEKNTRRQYERGTYAHNTVVINDENTSDVWGGFRIGKRAEVIITDEKPNTICAIHNGYFNKYKVNICRRFTLKDAFMAEDNVLGKKYQAQSIIILDPSVKIISLSEKEIITDVAVIKTSGCTAIEVKECEISKQYNSFVKTYKIVLYFNNKLKYSVDKTS